MQTRLKKLMKLAADGDNIALQNEAEKVLRAIESEKQGHQEAIDDLDGQVNWINSTLKFALPNSTPTATKPNFERVGKPVGDDGYTSKERGKLIVDAVTRMINNGIITFTADDILAELKRNGIIFTIGKPTSAISSVVVRMKGVVRTARNHYRYTGSGVQGDALPLIESQNAH